MTTASPSTTVLPFTWQTVSSVAWPRFSSSALTVTRAVTGSPIFTGRRKRSDCVLAPRREFLGILREAGPCAKAGLAVAEFCRVLRAGREKPAAISKSRWNDLSAGADR